MSRKQLAASALLAILALAGTSIDRVETAAQAGASTRARNEGATVLLDKIGGKWTVKALVNHWIS